MIGGDGNEGKNIEIFEHFAVDNLNCFLNNFSITLVDKTDVSITREGKSTFENCSSLWVKYLKLMVTSARFYTFFRGRSLINIKCVFLNLTWVFFEFSIQGCLIILFGGDSNRVETSQLICIASWLLDSYVMWDFSWGNFWTFLILSGCFSLVVSKLFNCI